MQPLQVASAESVLVKGAVRSTAQHLQTCLCVLLPAIPGSVMSSGPSKPVPMRSIVTVLLSILHKHPCSGETICMALHGIQLRPAHQLLVHVLLVPLKREVIRTQSRMFQKPEVQKPKYAGSFGLALKCCVSDLQGDLDLATEACLQALRHCIPHLHAARNTAESTTDTALDPGIRDEVAEQMYMLVSNLSSRALHACIMAEERAVYAG